MLFNLRKTLTFYKTSFKIYYKVYYVTTGYSSKHLKSIPFYPLLVYSHHNKPPFDLQGVDDFRLLFWYLDRLSFSSSEPAAYFPCFIFA